MQTKTMDRKRLTFSVFIAVLLWMESAVFFGHVMHPAMTIGILVGPVAAGVIVYRSDLR